jgi:pimeloyl-ACP methyl ester carboxylesterase
LLDGRRSHTVVAFQDVNGDGRWEPGEPIASGPAGARRRADLILGAGVPPPGVVLDLDRAATHSGLLHAGELRSLEGPPAGVLEQGLWEPLTAAKRRGLGVWFLQPYDPAKIPVLFVHGIGGAPGDFAALIAALDPERYQPWVASYPSGLRLSLVAEVLRTVLVDLRDRFDIARLFVVAHSMGGLVARAAVAALAAQHEAAFVALLVTLATPYGGHPLAALGMAYAPSRIPVWADLAPASGFLKGLEAPLPSSVRFALLFTFGERSMLVGGNNDGVVPLASQLAAYAQADASEVRGFDADHVGVLSDAQAIRHLNDLLDSSRGSLSSNRE